MKTTLLKSLFSILLILTATIAFSQQKETREVSDFSGIAMGIAGDLYLSQGSPRKVVISAKEDQIDAIETLVKNGVLHIKTDSWRTSFKDVKIWITVPDIDKIDLSGSGNIIAETAIQSEELEIRISGSGNIKLDKIQGKTMDLSISGSGNATLAGTGNTLGIRISGSGNLNGSGLQVGECKAQISGSGSCQVDATTKLDASISGSGRITYYSNPQVDASVSGSGKVKKGEK